MNYQTTDLRKLPYIQELKKIQQTSEYKRKEANSYREENDWLPVGRGKQEGVI